MVNEWPELLRIDALVDDQPAAGRVADRSWGARGELRTKAAMGRPVGDPDEWQDPDVGWGVVLPPGPEGMDDSELAAGADAPEPIRRLLGARGGPVLRFNPDDSLPFDRLLRHRPDGPPQPPEIGLTPPGTAWGQLPRYLLMVGGPDALPWELQYALQQNHFVGRLALDDDGLDNYVDALLGGFGAAASDPNGTLVWAVDNEGDTGITRLMRRTVAAQVARELDADAAATLIDCQADNATIERLFAALDEKHPGLVVTTSHGRTDPLNDPERMRECLGLLVDQYHTTLQLDELLGSWEPDGTVWYAHACCSAGSTAGTAFGDLLDPGSTAHRVVTAVGTLGDTVAPLPTRLLSAAKPARAFIGQVEPTFDWSLRTQDTGQFLTSGIVSAIVRGVAKHHTVGFAFEDHWKHALVLGMKWSMSRDLLNTGDLSARQRLFTYRLAALDHRSLVMLGDPTVALPGARPT